MYRFFAAVAIGVAATLAASMATATASSRKDESGVDAAKAVIDALDRCVQDRFVRIDKGFGMSRISMAMHNTSQFIPVVESERQVVRDLATMRVRLVMYLASWQKPRVGPSGYSKIPSLIQGPVLVNPAPRVVRTTPAGAPFEVHADPLLLKDLPNETEVAAQASRSLTALGEASSREFDVARWRFVARPVRASAETCLGCHNQRAAAAAASRASTTIDKVFRLGDPIGAVLYGYQASSGQH